jgi:hypothetical protein
MLEVRLYFDQCLGSYYVQRAQVIGRSALHGKTLCVTGSVLISSVPGRFLATCVCMVSVTWLSHVRRCVRGCVMMDQHVLAAPCEFCGVVLFECWVSSYKAI